MKLKPKGAKYRDLYAWRGSIWYSRMVRGRRYRVNTDAPISLTGWEEAAEGEEGDGTRTRAPESVKAGNREVSRTYTIS